MCPPLLRSISKTSQADPARLRANDPDGIIEVLNLDTGKTSFTVLENPYLEAASTMNVFNRFSDVLFTCVDAPPATVADTFLSAFNKPNESSPRDEHGCRSSSTSPSRWSRSNHCPIRTRPIATPGKRKGSSFGSRLHARADCPHGALPRRFELLGVSFEPAQPLSPGLISGL